MIATLQTGPTKEPVTLVEAFYQLRLFVPGEAPESHTDAAYVAGLITAARNYVENITRRALITQTWDYYRDSWPAGDRFELPYAPLQSVTSVKYTDTDGDETTLTVSTDYVVDTASEPGAIVLPYGETWPADQLNPKTPIVVRFVCGYGDDAANVPEEIKHAILLLVAHWYTNRLPVGEPQGRSGYVMLPLGLDALLSNHRMWRY